MAVAPHAGAWIEMYSFVQENRGALVAPHAGAWIEIYARQRREHEQRRRAPRGRVD